MALFTMTVQVDLPDATTQEDAESYVAFAVANYFAAKGLPGNASVTLKGVDLTASVLKGAITATKALS